MEDYGVIRVALQNLVAAMAVLRQSKVLNSKKDLNGEFGEWFVKTMFEGEYAPINQRYWDIKIGDKKIQVKTHAKGSANNNRFSRAKFHDTDETDELITIVFTYDYKLKHVYCNPWSAAREMIRRNKGGDVIYWGWQSDHEIPLKDLPNQALVAVFT